MTFLLEKWLKQIISYQNGMPIHSTQPSVSALRVCRWAAACQEKEKWQKEKRERWAERECINRRKVREESADKCCKITDILQAWDMVGVIKKLTSRVALCTPYQYMCSDNVSYIGQMCMHENIPENKDLSTDIWKYLQLLSKKLNYSGSMRSVVNGVNVSLDSWDVSSAGLGRSENSVLHHIALRLSYNDSLHSVLIQESPPDNFMTPSQCCFNLVMIQRNSVYCFSLVWKEPQMRLVVD